MTQPPKEDRQQYSCRVFRNITYPLVFFMKFYKFSWLHTIYMSLWIDSRWQSMILNVLFSNFRMSFVVVYDVMYGQLNIDQKTSKYVCISHGCRWEWDRLRWLAVLLTWDGPMCFAPWWWGAVGQAGGKYLLHCFTMASWLKTLTPNPISTPYPWGKG